MNLKIKGEEQEDSTYLRLVHDACGNVYLEASNDDGLCICILSVESDGTIKMLNANMAELKKLGFKTKKFSDRGAIYDGMGFYSLMGSTVYVQKG